MKRYEKIEFSFGFAVLYMGERIALVSTEPKADAVIREHKRPQSVGLKNSGPPYGRCKKRLHGDPPGTPRRAEEIKGLKSEYAETENEIEIRLTRDS